MVVNLIYKRLTMAKGDLVLIKPTVSIDGVAYSVLGVQTAYGVFFFVLLGFLSWYASYVIFWKIVQRFRRPPNGW
jgi:hypothetical protein